MLPASDFGAAVQRVAKPGDEPAVMGAYFPRTEYSDKARFESLGCRPSSLALRGRAIRARGGVALRPLRCTQPPGGCRGRVRLIARGTRRTVATGRFALAASGTGRAKVVLRRAARRRGLMRVVALAGGRTTAGVRLKARRSYTLRSR
jgi:hypothetical protein